MTKFKFLTHDIVSPQFNIASEEYLLKHTDGYYIYLWRNSPAVIVGVNQNTFAEVNLDYTEKNGIKVVRRITGGGAVYHDLNNICYTVIAPFDQTKNNYQVFAKPIVDYLHSLGVKAKFSGRNDLTVDGKKISGNAQTVFKDRIMHHGTILFKTDVDALTNSLKPSKLKIESKGIKSVSSRVTNVCEYVKDVTPEKFFDGLKKFMKKGLDETCFSKQDIESINALVKEKYSTDEWNKGYSPKGSLLINNRFSFGELSLTADLINGVISNAKISGDFFAVKDVDEICAFLNGKEFSKETFKKAFEKVGEYITGATASEIIAHAFD
ncbi:MAG: lipoate--protein ligase [Clostridia bacterium]|nr:lipoate--protein ligase [Clostridia bacterium]